MNKYLAEFEISVGFRLDEDQRHEAFRAINMHYMGRPQFRDFMEKAEPAHEDAAFACCRNYNSKIKVGLRTDGRLEIIGIIDK